MYNQFTTPEERQKLRDQYGCEFIAIGVEPLHYKNLNEPHFTNVMQGNKTIEGRPNTDKIKKYLLSK